MPGGAWFVLVMLGSILANYGFGLWVDACKRAGRTCAPPLVTALAVNLGILFVFKYLTFTLGILNRLGAAFAIPGIELPIGISFYTMQRPPTSLMSTVKKCPPTAISSVWPSTSAFSPC